MANFQPKSLQQIISGMAAKMSAETPISDFTEGSVVLTLLETAAVEDFQQYVQMLNIIRNYRLDTTEGEDLDDRAEEYGLTRLQPLPHSGLINIFDNRFTKISTKLYAGLAGPTSGTTTIFVDDASSFPATGQIYIGRGTTNSEGPIAYSAAPVDNTSFWTITLDVALINDHGTDEAVVLAQFGDRLITAGTEVEIPENDVSEQVLFEINQTVTLLDGEDTLTNVLVTASDPGDFSVPANSIIAFANTPFTGATVTNPLPFVNGRSEETDQELRDRIRRTIQSLSRGTSQAIENSIVGLIDEETNQSIVSAKVVPPVILADGPTRVFIDNGRGLEPSITSVGLESVLTLATGGEKFFQLENFPLAKANLISQNTESFALFGLETLLFKVGTNEETFTFVETDFEVPGTAKANEVSEAINNRSVLVEARTITDSDGVRLILNPRARTNENFSIDETSTANIVLNFSNEEVFTLKLYKNDKLLIKDGLTASLISLPQPFNLDTAATATTDGDITVTAGSRVVTKTVAGTDPFKQLVHPGDYIKFSTDSDDAFVKVRTVVSDTKFILEDSYSLAGGGLGDIIVWNSPQIEVAANGDLDETEVVSFSPNDFANAAQALASEVLTRMLLEVNLSKVELAVNDTRVKVISEKENTSESKMQIVGGAGSLAMGFTSIKTITGTVTVTGGEVVVSGTGTVFTEELQEGQWIKVDSDNNGAWTKIETIEDDTTLYLTEGYRGLDGASVAGSYIEFSEVSEGSDKDYVLNRSNGQIELTTPLVANDRITAGSINTRAFSDSVQETFDFDSLGASSTLIVCVDGGFPATVTTGDAAAPYNSFIDTELIGYESAFFDGFYLEWVTGNNKGENSFVASYDESTGQIDTISGFTNPVVAGDKFIMCQVLTFVHATDFADPENALASEVVSAINDEILGARAQELITSAVRIRTSNFDEIGKIQIKGGSANSILGFSTQEQENQATNLAYVVSQNSDRNGNPSAIGYTLGPNQTLVTILDEDPLNKTFSVTMDVKGTVSAVGGVGTFSDSSLASKYTSDDYFNDFYIYWTSGANEGSVQVVTDYVAVSGTITTSDVRGTAVAATNGDTFAIVPRTAENIVKHLSDLNTTTFSISGSTEVTNISGDFVQISTKTPGSEGKVFLTGGTANSLGIAIQSIPAGAPVNDLSVNSVAGLSKGLLTNLTVDGEVTTGDAAAPFDTFIDTSMISAFPSYFDGMNIEFLTGQNQGLKTTIASYDNTTGEIVLTDAASSSIDVEDSYRISTPVYINNITGTEAPYTIAVNDIADVALDVSAFVPGRSATIRDNNGLNFSNIQVEGVDGYKHFTGLIQKAQWTIDGLDRDSDNYPPTGASGTQFEVLTPVLVQLNLVVNITTIQGVSLSSVSGDVSNSILEYVNTLQVGQDVILSEIICAALGVTGVADAEIENLTDNVVIQDGEIARLDTSDLIIG